MFYCNLKTRCLAIAFCMLTYAYTHAHTPTHTHVHKHTHARTHMHARTHDTHTDPYVVISFDRYTDRTCVLEQTVSPKWDQSFLFHNVSMYGDPSVTLDTPPSIVIKFYDQDQLVRWYPHVKNVLSSSYRTGLSRFDMQTTYKSTGM